VRLNNPALQYFSLRVLGMLAIFVCVAGGCGRGGDPITQHFDPLLITSSAPPSGTVGVPYGPVGGFSVTASGGMQPYNWSWAAASGSTLPPGLSFSALGIQGQPTAKGTYIVTITVSDSQIPPVHAINNYTIEIADVGQLAITSGNPPDGVAGNLYGSPRVWWCAGVKVLLRILPQRYGWSAAVLVQLGGTARLIDSSWLKARFERRMPNRF